jgi:hypothetical protein
MKYAWRMLLILVLPLLLTICAAQDLVSIIHGTVKKVDKDTKTVVIKTSDGTEHTIKVADEATVHGTDKGFDGLKEGSEVVARCSKKGADKTADDLGKVGKDGMKVTKGTITKIDKGTKTMVVKSGDGAEKAFEYTDDAAKDLDSLLVPIPVAGPDFRFYLTNSPRVFVEGDVFGMYFFGYGNYLSSFGTLGITVTRRLSVNAGYQLGSRLVVNNNSSSNRIGLSMTQKGPIVGLEFSF